MLLTYDAIRKVRNPCERFWKRLSFFSKPLLPLCLWEEDPESYRAVRDNLQRMDIPTNIPCGTCVERHELRKKGGVWLEVRAGEQKCSERYMKPLRVRQDQKMDMYKLDLEAVLARWAEKWPVRPEVKQLSDVVTWQLGVGRLIESGDSAPVLVCLSHLPFLVGAELNGLNLTPPYIVLHACDDGLEFLGLPKGVRTYPLWTFLTFDVTGQNLAESIFIDDPDGGDSAEEPRDLTGSHEEIRKEIQALQDGFSQLQGKKDSEAMNSLKQIMHSLSNLSIEEASTFQAFWKAQGHQKKAWESLPEDRRKSYQSFNRHIKGITSKLDATPKKVKRALAVAPSKSISPAQINSDVDVGNLSGISKDEEWAKDKNSRDRILRDFHQASPDDKKEMKKAYKDIQDEYDNSSYSPKK